MMLSSFIRFKHMVLERHTGASPETYLKHRFDGVRSDLSSFIHLNPFFMRTPNGQHACLEGNLTQSVKGSSLNGPKVLNSLNPAEAEFINSLKFQGVEDLIHSLKRIHDLALYHTDLCFDREEKSALFDLKILWEGLEQMAERG